MTTMGGSRLAGRPVVEVRRLTCGYRLGGPREVIALEGIDLDLAPGELMAVVGSATSGKTTLLRVLAGLLPPAAGLVLVGRLDLAQATASQLDEHRRSLVGYVSQPPADGLWTQLTAVENVQAPMLVSGVPRRERRERAESLLEELRFGGRHEQLPPQLPGGEQLRLALAVALANRPLLLLLDEPGGQLDSDTLAAVLGDLQPMLRRLGAAALITTTSPELQVDVDRVTWIGGG